MSSLKILAAVAAATTFSLAFAQSTPPQPASNPAVGAGQRSTQETPMGTTGTPGSGGAAAQGSTAGSAASGTMGSGSTDTMNSGSTSGSMGSGSSASGSGSTMDTGTGTRGARADRN